MAHINEYIKNLIKDNIKSKALGKDDLLIECEITIEHKGNDFIVKMVDDKGNDITDLAEAVLSKGDTSTLRGLYTIIKFRMD